MKAKLLVIGLISILFGTVSLVASANQVNDISSKLRAYSKYNFVVGYNTTVQSAETYLMGNKCAITLNPEVINYNSNVIAFILAHEINHCIELIEWPKPNIKQDNNMKRIYDRLHKTVKHNMEYRSDLFAVDVICEAGFNAQDGWKTLFTLFDHDESDTHPSSKNRMKMITSDVKTKESTGYHRQLHSLTPNKACN